tara:strand:+ start:2517 stop:2861 length:345 start_codon:yes stop_codon:yes gene_type:complete
MSSIIFKGADRDFTLTDLEKLLSDTEINKNKGSNFMYSSYEASVNIGHSQQLHIFCVRRRMKRLALIGSDYSGRARRFNSSRPSTTMEIYICRNPKGLYHLLDSMYQPPLKEAK